MQGLNKKERPYFKNTYTHKDLAKGPLPCELSPEGSFIPEEVGFILDSHVHLFPDKLFQAIWRWFDQYGWEIRYKLSYTELIEFLFSKGVRNFVALSYAHKPGLAMELNQFILQTAAHFPGIIGFATVFPGEEEASKILKHAFDQGLKGVKLHPHVQYFSPDSEAMQKICQVCSEQDKPIILHAGQEPKTPLFNYPQDPYELCHVDKVKFLLKNFPKLRLCVPHLGAGEFQAYRELAFSQDNLWLDTSMAISNFLPGQRSPALGEYRADRLMYGSDFPNIPYAWDKEIYLALEELDKQACLEDFFWKNALKFLNISEKDLVNPKKPGF